jgi:hypothetical protein
MQLTLNLSPVVVKDENGTVILEQPLFDLFYLFGRVLQREENKNIDSEDKEFIQRTRKTAIADELNKQYMSGGMRTLDSNGHEVKFSWGSAEQLVIEVEKEVASLKKNGTGVQPLANSEESPSLSRTSPE